MAARARSSSIRRRLLFRAASVALALLAAFAAGEGAIRMALTVNYRGMLDRLPESIPSDPLSDMQLSEFIQADGNERLGYRMKPSAAGLFRGAEVRINQYGYRDDPPVVPKPAGMLRVVGLGDSTMFGTGVAQSEAYMALLEKSLREHYAPQGIEADCAVLAAPGYNTVQEAEALRAYAGDLEPDAVVIQFDQNDLLAQVGTIQPDFLTARYLFAAHPRMIWRADFADIGAFFLLNQVDRMAGEPSPLNGWQAVEDAFRSLAKECRGRGAALIALLIAEDMPDLGGDPPPHPAHARIARFWKEEGIDFVDAGPEARAYLIENRLQWSALTVAAGDPHPNAAGHALIAQELAGRVIKALESKPKSGSN